MELQLQQVKKILRHKSFWVLATLTCLGILHLYYIWKVAAKLPSLLDGLGWLSIGFLLWKNQSKIKFRGSLFSSLVGLLLIIWMLIRHSFRQFSSSVDILSYFFPVITFTGLLLIVSGFRKLKNYHSEILIATLISLPFASIYNWLKPIVNIDAQLLNFILHYLGFDSIREGAVVSLPNGSVEVMPSCSSVGPILTMLPLIVVLLSIYPTSKSKQFFVYLSTIGSIFLINGIRLSLLAILLNKGDIANFEYWHTGGGSGIFSNLIVFLIGGVSYQILNSSSKPIQEVLT
ncbi:MAG: hypothetical protein DCF19_03715 [Pseudanabaena frigida]|uniref:Cyanoexosortase A n=1 Tax=Pseudanabaena frigida TaxID=945775 RepID=A0A2W4WKP3_9CYAN|nr:MAG: hypothetical protein DCF19_03715 [Pseudanabaena frigida]